MNTVKLFALSLAFSLTPAIASAAPNLGPHQGKKILHFSKDKQKSWKVCNQNAEQPVLRVYVGRNARMTEIRYGECKEFKSKEISIDPPKQSASN